MNEKPAYATDSEEERKREENLKEHFKFQNSSQHQNYQNSRGRGDYRGGYRGRGRGRGYVPNINEYNKNHGYGNSTQRGYVSIFEERGGIS